MLSVPSLNWALMACEVRVCSGRYTLSSVRSVESWCSCACTRQWTQLWATICTGSCAYSPGPAPPKPADALLKSIAGFSARGHHLQCLCSGKYSAPCKLKLAHEGQVAHQRWRGRLHRRIEQLRLIDAALLQQLPHAAAHQVRAVQVHVPALQQEHILRLGSGDLSPLRRANADPARIVTMSCSRLLCTVPA